MSVLAHLLATERTAINLLPTEQQAARRIDLEESEGLDYFRLDETIALNLARR